MDDMPVGQGEHQSFMQDKGPSTSEEIGERPRQKGKEVALVCSFALKKPFNIFCPKLPPPFLKNLHLDNAVNNAADDILATRSPGNAAQCIQNCHHRPYVAKLNLSGCEQLDVLCCLQTQ